MCNNICYHRKYQTYEIRLINCLSLLYYFTIVIPQILIIAMQKKLFFTNKMQNTEKCTCCIGIIF